MIVWLVAVVGCFVLGAKGFSAKGIPLYRGRYIQGKTANRLGYGLIASGVVLFVAWMFWFAMMWRIGAST
jgi:hypothetical protein